MKSMHKDIRKDEGNQFAWAVGIKNQQELDAFEVKCEKFGFSIRGIYREKDSTISVMIR